MYFKATLNVISNKKKVLVTQKSIYLYNNFFVCYRKFVFYK